MSLLLDIQKSAIDEKKSVPELLRMCRVLAHELGNGDLAEWAQKELQGYAGMAELPAYRILWSGSAGDFTNGFSALKSRMLATSTFPEEFRKLAEAARLYQPVSDLVEIANAMEKDDNMRLCWAADYVHYLNTIKHWGDVECTRLYWSVSDAHIKGLLQAIRDTVLSYVLDIRSVTPSDGKADEDLALPAVREASKNVFITNILGGTSNVAVGSTSVRQTLSVVVRPGDAASLQEFLASQGLASPDIDDLQRAIEDDGVPSDPNSPGGKVAAWLGRWTLRASGGVGSSIAANVIWEAVRRYYGVG